jgi:hypothetical protein
LIPIRASVAKGKRRRIALLRVAPEAKFRIRRAVTNSELQVEVSMFC